VPDEKLDEKLAEARRVLMGLPGVFGVGYGYRERGGVTTQELCFRVYVHEKRPLSALAPDDVVPSELFGIPTDVLVVLRSDALTCVSMDAHEPLVGGIGISNLKLWLAGGAAGGEVEWGTLGFFGTLHGTSSRDRYALLSCNHVLAAQGAAKGDKIYQPQLRIQGGVPIITRMEDIHPIGSIEDLGVRENRNYTYADGTGTGKYFLDCATAKIATDYSSWCKTNKGVNLKNLIRGLDLPDLRPSPPAPPQPRPPLSWIDGIARVRPQDLPPAGAPPYLVYKVGRTTGRTVGKIKAANEPVTDNATGLVQENCILIENVGPNCEGGTKFALKGDSGSVIVNSDRRIVGLLFGGDTTLGTGHGCHIHPVLDRMGITLISPGNRILGSSEGTLFDAEMSVDGCGADVTRAAELREEILQSERGRAYTVLVERHREEVVYLVNSVRPVTVAWHRARGPDYLAHAAHASHHAGHTVPRRLAGVGRDEALASLQEAFERHGTASLRADLAEHAEELRRLVDEVDDIEQLAERLRAPSPAPTPAGGG
jgi:hypothetical protein